MWFKRISQGFSRRLDVRRLDPDLIRFFNSVFGFKIQTVNYRYQNIAGKASGNQIYHAFYGIVFTPVYNMHYQLFACLIQSRGDIEGSDTGVGTILVGSGQGTAEATQTRQVMA